MKNGIIYKGKSLIDNKPIVVIATLTKSNVKTTDSKGERRIASLYFS